MTIIAILALLYYCLSWQHAIMRWRTGGKPGSKYGGYCADPGVPADTWSALGIIFGTIILIAIIALLSYV